MNSSETKQTSSYELFESLVLRIRGRLYRRAYQALHNAADAEDSTQEAIVRAWMHLDTFRTSPYRDSECVMAGWLHRIALNELRNLIRHRRRYRTLSLDAPMVDAYGGALVPELADRSHDPATRIVINELSEQVHQAMERLSPDHRTCLLLLREERSYQEIGALLNCPLGTVRSRVHRARAFMRQALQAE